MKQLNKLQKNVSGKTKTQNTCSKYIILLNLIHNNTTR